MELWNTLRYQFVKELQSGFLIHFRGTLKQIHFLQILRWSQAYVVIIIRDDSNVKNSWIVKCEGIIFEALEMILGVSFYKILKVSKSNPGVEFKGDSKLEFFWKIFKAFNQASKRRFLKNFNTFFGRGFLIIFRRIFRRLYFFNRRSLLRILSRL